MKKNIIILTILSMLLIFGACKDDFTEELTNSTKLKSGNSGNDKATGFDQWGYNWNAQQFKGYLMNAWFGDEMDPSASWYKKEPPYNGDWEGYAADHPEVLNYPFWGYGNMTLVMHWNDDLISSEGVYNWPRTDTDGWITFHYRMGEGKNKWSQYQKFVAVKSTDVLKVYYEENGTPVWGEWFSEEGESVGWYYLWPEMALIQVVNTGNVPDGMLPGYKSPMGNGIGKYKSR